MQGAGFEFGVSGPESSYAVPTLVMFWFGLLIISAAKRKILYTTILLIAGLWPSGLLTIIYSTGDQSVAEIVGEIFHGIGLVWWISIPIALAVYGISWSQENQHKFEEEANK